MRFLSQAVLISIVFIFSSCKKAGQNDSSVPETSPTHAETQPITTLPTPDYWKQELYKTGENECADAHRTTVNPECSFFIKKSEKNKLCFVIQAKLDWSVAPPRGFIHYGVTDQKVAIPYIAALFELNEDQAIFSKKIEVSTPSLFGKALQNNLAAVQENGFKTSSDIIFNTDEITISDISNIINGLTLQGTNQNLTFQKETTPNTVVDELCDKLLKE